MRLGAVRFHNPEPIHTVAFTPDGQALLVFAHHYPNRALRLWNIADGKELARFDLKDANYPDAWYTRAVCFTPDGKGIVLRRENVVELVDRQSGKSIHVLNGKDKFHAMALSPDGKVVALASPEKGKKTTICFWEMATGQLRAQFQVDSDWFFGLQFSSDGKRLLTASRGKKDGGIVQAWELSSGKMLHEVDVDNQFYIAFSPDGCAVATRNDADRNDDKGDIRVVRVADGATVCRFTPAPNRNFASFAFTPDGKALITIASGHTPCLWDAATGKQIRAFGGLPASAVKMGGFSTDGKRFAVIVGNWLRENAVRLWNVETGEEIRPFDGHADEVTALAYSPDGKTLASGGYDCTVRLWDPSTGRERRCLQGHKERVLALAFSPNGATLASASADGTTRLWRISDGMELAKLDGPGRPGAERPGMFEREGMKLVFAVDGKTLHAVDDSTGYCAWKLTTGRRLERKQFGNDGERLIGLSSDGDTVLAYAPKNFEEGKAPESLSLWEVATGKRELTLPRRLSKGNSHDMACVGAELSRDNRLVAGSSRRYQTFEIPPDTFYGDPALRIWERLSGREILTIDAYSQTLAFSPDGKLIAGNQGGGDPRGWGLFNESMGSVFLWDTTTGMSRKEFAHHTAEVRCLAFAPDGKTLASGSADHTVLIWDCSQTFANEKLLPELSAKELEALWKSLASENALEARQAMARLAGCKAPASGFLGTRLKPATAPDPKHLAALIQDLSSEEYAIRERTSEALAELGELALPAFKKAMVSDPDAEVRSRLKQIVRRAIDHEYRRIRAVAVLEEIADDAAVRALESLEKGLPESRQTVEALISLRCLRK